MVTFDAKPGQPYKSPYASFFNNIEAGRTSLGTTLEIEQRAHEMKEKVVAGIPESALRFRTTSYERSVLAPYVEAGEHRVIVKLSLSSIPFDNAGEREVFLQMVGPRYKAKSGDLQLSCEKFASRIENKRHLVNVIERLVEDSKRLSKEFAEEDEKMNSSA